MEVVTDLLFSVYTSVSGWMNEYNIFITYANIQAYIKQYKSINQASKQAVVEGQGIRQTKWLDWINHQREVRYFHLKIQLQHFD